MEGRSLLRAHRPAPAHQIEATGRRKEEGWLGEHKQDATCNVGGATCNVGGATCNVNVAATCNMGGATCYVGLRHM